MFRFLLCILADLNSAAVCSEKDSQTTFLGTHEQNSILQDIERI
jgi:hypothetical protein